MAINCAVICPCWQIRAACCARNAERHCCAKSGRRRFHSGKLTTGNSRRWPRRRTISSDFDMRAILHILTKTNDDLAAAVIAAQRAQPDARVNVVDLTAPEPDYDALLEAIFAADAVSVW